jgi:hypothetical protein
MSILFIIGCLIFLTRRRRWLRNLTVRALTPSSLIIILLLLILSHHKLLAGLVPHLEAAEKALTEERSTWQIADQDLRIAQDSTSVLNRELSSKVTALEELSGQERAAQDALRALADEKTFAE